MLLVERLISPLSVSVPVSLPTRVTPLAGTAVMSPAQADGFVRSLNAVRLVLGTLLDVSEDHDPDLIGPDDPMFAEHQLYMFLSWLLEMTLSA